MATQASLAPEARRHTSNEMEFHHNEKLQRNNVATTVANQTQKPLPEAQLGQNVGGYLTRRRPKNQTKHLSARQPV